MDKSLNVIYSFLTRKRKSINIQWSHEMYLCALPAEQKGWCRVLKTVFTDCASKVAYFFFFFFFLWEHLLCASIQVSPKRFTLENLIIIALFSAFRADPLHSSRMRLWMRVTVALQSAFSISTEVVTVLFGCYMAGATWNACLGIVHFFILGLEYISKQEGWTTGSSACCAAQPFSNYTRLLLYYQ